jgi:hypothetical protein
MNQSIPNTENIMSQPHEISDSYLSAAKINQDNLWKRRQIEWGSSFSLWSAIAVSTAFIFKEIDKPIESPYSWISLVVLCIIYFIILYIQNKHLKAHYISNEKDLLFIKYYLNKSESALNEDSTKIATPNLEVFDSFSYCYKKNDDDAKKKLKAKIRLLLLPLMITLLIEILSIMILAYKVISIHHYCHHCCS